MTQNFENYRKCQFIYIVFIGLTFTLYLIYPMGFNLNSLLDFHYNGKFRYLDDPAHFINYTCMMKEQILDGKAIWEVVFHNPNFSLPLTYLLPGSILAMVINPVVVYNLFFIIWLTLTFLCMYIYAFKICKNRIGALYSAMTFEGSNYMIHHILDGHQNLTQLFWFPLIFYLVEKLFEKPGYKISIFLGLCFSGLIFTSAQYSVYLSIILPVYVIWRKQSSLLEKKIIAALGGSIIIAIFTVRSYLLESIKHAPIKYDISTNLFFSLKSPVELFQWNNENYLGLIPIFLSIVAVKFIIKKKDFELLVFPFIILLGIILMAGPSHVLSPYNILYKLIPVIQYIRTPLRFIVFVLLAASILSSLSIAYIYEKCHKRLGHVIFALIFVLTALTHYAPSIYYSKDRFGGHSIWIRPYPLKIDRRKTHFYQLKNENDFNNVNIKYIRL